MEKDNEAYQGIKFSVISGERLSDPVPDQRSALLKWCLKFERDGLTPDYGLGNAGNLSFRTKAGFCITPTACYYKDMTLLDIVEVYEVDPEKRVLRCMGTHRPSSESIMHWMIYQKRKDINAIFHGHSEAILASSELFLCTEKKLPYGSLELARQASSYLSGSDFLVLKGHGFIAIGADLDQAGRLAIDMVEKVR